tara:strand:- start:1378 stop:1671 length:294 start_codon:yes stop_codon:yes gene_type:complete
MEKKNTQEQSWPTINSIIVLNPGTRIDTGNGTLAIIPSCDEEYIGVVVELFEGNEFFDDRMDVLVGDRIYTILRTPGSSGEEDPYFNISILEDNNEY